MSSALALRPRVPTPAGTVAPRSAVDLALVRRAQAGDDQAFGQLVERNRRAVYRAAFAALGSAEDAEDVAQETFVAVYQKLQGFRGESAFRTWLLAIAWRKALDRRRSVTRWLRMTVTHDRADGDDRDLVEQMPDTSRTQEGPAVRRRPAADRQAADRHAAAQAARRLAACPAPATTRTSRSARCWAFRWAPSSGESRKRGDC